MLNDGRADLRRTDRELAGLCIMATVLAFNPLSGALRNAPDSHLRR